MFLIYSCNVGFVGVGFDSFYIAAGKGFGFHSFTDVAIFVASLNWISVILGCVFEKVEWVILFSF